MESNARQPADIEVVPDRFEYIGPDKVRIVFKTKAGNTLAFRMTTAMAAKQINLAIEMFNERPGRILSDLGAF